MLPDRPRTSLIVGLTVCLLAVGLAGAAYGIWLGPALRFLPDEQDYLTIAHNLLSGLGFTIDGRAPTAFRAPGVALLYVIAAATPHPAIVARLLNVLCLLGTAILVFALVRPVYGDRFACIAAIACAVYPLAFFTAGTVYPQSLGSLLMLGAIVAWLRYTTAGAVFAGALAGLAALTIPTLLPSLALLFFCDAFIRRRRLYVGRALLGLACACLVIAPWTLRNRLALGEWVPVTTNSGINLLLGNSANASANSGTNVDISAYASQVASLSEAQQDRAYSGFAVQWIQGHPDQAAALYVRKWLNFFNFHNELTTATEASPLRDLISALTYYPLLILAVAGLGLAMRVGYSKAEVLLWVVYLSGAFVTAVFFTRLRFRVPYDHVLVVLAAMSLARLAGAARDVKRGAVPDALRPVRYEQN